MNEISIKKISDDEYKLIIDYVSFNLNLDQLLKIRKCINEIKPLGWETEYKCTWFPPL